MPRKQRIFYSALLLTAVNLLLRFVGTSFQVYLSGRIGAEGIGLLQLVLSVGSMAMVAGMAGIRTATMYLTAEELGKNRPGGIPWVLSGCILYSIVCSAAVGAAVYYFAPIIAEKWIGQIEVVDSIRLFALFLPVNCLTGVMVGYFTGANRIRMLAAVEVAEQACVMLCTVSLLTLWSNHEPAKSCFSVVLGSGMGSCITLSSLMILRLLEKNESPRQIPIARRLLDTAVPLAIADDLRTGISTIENLIVPKRLALYPGTISPLASFGTVCGMVFPVLMFPTAILFGLTELLVPELARCNAAGSQKRISHLVQKSLRVGLLYGTLCAGILYLTADSLCLSLYGSMDAGTYLKWFAPLAVMLYCDVVTDAMIKGLGQQKASVRYNITTNIMDVSLLYILLPNYGIGGYFFSFLITHAINYFLSIRRLLWITEERISIKIPITTLAVAWAAVWAAGFVSQPVLSALAFSVLLFCGLFLCGVLSKEDILWVKGLICKH